MEMDLLRPQRHRRRPCINLNSLELVARSRLVLVDLSANRKLKSNSKLETLVISAL